VLFRGGLRDTELLWLGVVEAAGDGVVSIWTSCIFANALRGRGERVKLGSSVKRFPFQVGAEACLQARESGGSRCWAVDVLAGK
jgi:hypothetical protein